MDTLSLGQLAVPLLCASSLVVLLLATPVLAAALVLLALVGMAVVLRSPAMDLGIWIYPHDVLFVMLGIAGLLRSIFSLRHIDRTRIMVALLLVLLTLSFVRGAEANGLKPAGVEVRQDFYFLAGLLYFSSFAYTARRQRKIVWLWLVAAIILVCLAVFRWIATFAGWNIAGMWAEQAGVNPFRVLTAAETFVVAIALFLSMCLRTAVRTQGWQRTVFYVFIPAVLLLQHRSVWTAVLVGGVWLLFQDVRTRRRWILLLAGTGLFTLFFILLVFGSHAMETRQALETSARDSGTFEWRIEGWRQLLAQDIGPLGYAVGLPYGSGFVRWVENETVDVAPHNYFVQVVLRLGAIGLGLLLSLYLVCWHGLQKFGRLAHCRDGPDARFWRLVLILQLVFFVPYSPGYDQGMLLGIALSLIRCRQPVLEHTYAPTYCRTAYVP